MDAAGFSCTHTMTLKKDLSLRSIVISLFMNVFLFDLYNMLDTLLDRTIQLIVWIIREERIFILLIFKSSKTAKIFSNSLREKQKSIDIEKRKYIDI